MARQAAAVLAELPETITAPAIQRIANLRGRLAPPAEFSLDRHQQLDAEVYRLREETLGVESAKFRSADDGKRSPVEIY